MDRGTEDELLVLSKVVEVGSDPDWGTRLILLTTPEEVCQGGIPAGWQLHRGEEALRFLQASVAEEVRYQREQKTQEAGGGAN